MIISASRRTDLPAFYPEETVKKIIDLHSMQESVDCVVFWTKDARPLMPFLTESLECAMSWYFQYTLTPYQIDFEPGVNHKPDIIANMQEISKRYGKDALVWRYDPIIITDKYSHWYHQKVFTKACQQLEGYTDTCVVSFVDVYGKLEQIAQEHEWKTLSYNAKTSMLGELQCIAECYGIHLETCAEDINLNSGTCRGIRKAQCVDPARIARITGKSFDYEKDPSQRKLCGCMRSVDIGEYYQECLHKCVYCYAQKPKNNLVQLS